MYSNLGLELKLTGSATFSSYFILLDTLDWFLHVFRDHHITASFDNHPYGIQTKSPVSPIFPFPCSSSITLCLENQCLGIY